MDISGARWFTSSFSGSANDDNCVEVTFLDGAVAARDAKNRAAGALIVPRAAWSEFVAGVRSLPRQCPWQCP